MSLVGFNIDCVNLNANKMLTDARDFDVTLVTDNSNQRVMFGFGPSNVGRVALSESNVFVNTQLLVSSNDTVSVPGYSWQGDTSTGMYHLSNNQIGLACAGNSILTVTSLGIGVKSSSPACPVHVIDNGGLAEVRVERALPDTNNNLPAYLTCYKSRGTNAAPTALASNDMIGSVASFGHDGTSFKMVSEIRTHAENNGTNNTIGSRIVLATRDITNSAVLTDRMIIRSTKVDVMNNLVVNSSLGVGTSSLNTARCCISTAGSNLLHLENTVGGNGTACTNIVFSTWTGGSNAVFGVLDDNFSAHFRFLTRDPGAGTNGLTERVRITNTGNVGIGTTTPSSALHVIGVINASTKLQQAGNDVTVMFAPSNHTHDLNGSSMTGVLPISKGGTSTNANTGTGSLVLATNPYISDPVISGRLSVGSYMDGPYTFTFATNTNPSIKVPFTITTSSPSLTWGGTQLDWYGANKFNIALPTQGIYQINCCATYTNAKGKFKEYSTQYISLEYYNSSDYRICFGANLCGGAISIGSDGGSPIKQPLRDPWNNNLYLFSYNFEYIHNFSLDISAWRVTS